LSKKKKNYKEPPRKRRGGAPDERQYTFFDLYDLDEAYNKEFTDTAEEWLRRKNKNITSIRLKTIISGDMLESECYPIWNTRAEINRAPKANESRKAQRNLNNKNAVKNVVRLINANFTKNDCWFTGTFKDEFLPPTPAAADKYMRNFIRRVKREAIKRGYPELKYIFVTEMDEEAKVRLNNHLIINFPDRDKLEELWRAGRTQARRLQPDEFGFEGVARYITKDPKGTRRYTASKNLVRPKVYISDCRMTRGKVGKIICGRLDAKEAYEKIYKGFAFTDYKHFISNYISGDYLYVRMRRRD